MTTPNTTGPSAEIKRYIIRDWAASAVYAESDLSAESAEKCAWLDDSYIKECDHLAALSRAREEARREAEERERAESQRAIDGVRRLLEVAQREAEFWKPYRIRREDGDEVLCISLRFSRLSLECYRGDPLDLIWKALERVPADAARALGRTTPTPQGETKEQS